MRLLIRWVIVSLALFVAALLVPGSRVEGAAWIVFAAMAIVLGLVVAESLRRFKIRLHPART